MGFAKKAPRLLDIDFYIEAAKKHGEISEPDFEVGDLQELFRHAWASMTPEQKLNFAQDPAVQSLLEVSCELTELQSELNAFVQAGRDKL